MAKITNDLLKEAIADAEKVRETAIANAKIQLEEAIAPAIKKEITRVLNQDVAEAVNPHKGSQAQDFGEVGESAPAGSSEVGKSDNKMPSKDASDTSGVGSGGESGNGEGETPQIMPEVESAEGEELDEIRAEMGRYNNEDGGEDMDGELNLEDIIRELQREVEALSRLEGYGDDEGEFGNRDGEEDSLDVPDMGMDGDSDGGDGEYPPRDDFSDDDEEMEEDFDLDAILREIEAELSEEDGLQVAEENAKLKTELAEYRKAVQLLSGKLNEVNLLNAKLLFTNKLFKGRELTQEQKIHVVQTFDLATTLREVKLLYATLAESTMSVPKKPAKQKVSQSEVVTESIASSVTGPIAPKTEVITEDSFAQFRTRMQELAGVKVL